MKMFKCVYMCARGDWITVFIVHCLERYLLHIALIQTQKEASTGMSSRTRSLYSRSRQQNAETADTGLEDSISSVYSSIAKSLGSSQRMTL